MTDTNDIQQLLKDIAVTLPGTSRIRDQLLWCAARLQEAQPTGEIGEALEALGKHYQAMYLLAKEAIPTEDEALQDDYANFKDHLDTVKRWAACVTVVETANERLIEERDTLTAERDRLAAEVELERAASQAVTRDLGVALKENAALTAALQESEEGTADDRIALENVEKLMAENEALTAALEEAREYLQTNIDLLNGVASEDCANCLRETLARLTDKGKPEVCSRCNGKKRIPAVGGGTLGCPECNPHKLQPTTQNEAPLPEDVECFHHRFNSDGTCQECGLETGVPDADKGKPEGERCPLCKSGFRTMDSEGREPHEMDGGIAVCCDCTIYDDMETALKGLHKEPNPDPPWKHGDPPAQFTGVFPAKPPCEMCGGESSKGTGVKAKVPCFKDCSGSGKPKPPKICTSFGAKPPCEMCGGSRYKLKDPALRRCGSRKFSNLEPCPRCNPKGKEGVE